MMNNEAMRVEESWKLSQVESQVEVKFDLW